MSIQTCLKEMLDFGWCQLIWSKLKENLDNKLIFLTFTAKHLHTLRNGLYKCVIAMFTSSDKPGHDGWLKLFELCHRNLDDNKCSIGYNRYTRTVCLLYYAVPHWLNVWLRLQEFHICWGLPLLIMGFPQNAQDVGQQNTSIELRRIWSKTSWYFIDSDQSFNHNLHNYLEHIFVGQCVHSTAYIYTSKQSKVRHVECLCLYKYLCTQHHSNKLYLAFGLFY